MKIDCQTRLGGCPQKPFVRLGEAAGDKSEVSETMVDRTKVARLVDALEKCGIVIDENHIDIDADDPDRLIDLLTTAAENAAKRDQYEGAEVPPVIMSLGGYHELQLPKTRSEREAATKAKVDRFFEMLPGRRVAN